MKLERGWLGYIVTSRLKGKPCFKMRERGGRGGRKEGGRMMGRKGGRGGEGKGAGRERWEERYFIHKTSFIFCSEVMLSVRALNLQQDKEKLWLK